MKKYWWLLILISALSVMVGVRIATQATPEERAAAEFRNLTTLIEIVDEWNLENGNPESLMRDFYYLKPKMIARKVVDEVGWSTRYRRLAEGKLAYCLQALVEMPNRSVFAARPDDVAKAIRTVRESGGNIANAVDLAGLTAEQASACSMKSWNYIKEPGFDKDEFELLIQALTKSAPGTRT